MSKSPTGDIALSNQYVAGMFDGEGCITTSRRFIKGKYEKYPRVSMQITITNCHTTLLKLIEKWFGGGITHKGKKKNENMPCYHWRVLGKLDMVRFLNSIKEYSIVKKEQIKLALEFCETLREENLGCKPLSKEVHALRDKVHFGLRRLKKEGMA